MSSSRMMLPITRRFGDSLARGAGCGSGWATGLAAGAGAGLGAGAGWDGATGAPQFSQNLAPSGSWAPHCSQNMMEMGYFFLISLTFSGMANVEAGILTFSSNKVTIWELLAPRMPLVSIFRMMPSQTQTL